MKVFVTGVCGQLGFDVVNELIRRGYEVAGSDISEKSSLVQKGFKTLPSWQDALKRYLKEIGY